jgi:hypothetical protein
VATKRDLRGHGEFSGGPGLIDPVRRAERVVGNDSGTAVMYNLGEELKEIYATDPADEASTPENAVVERP